MSLSHVPGFDAKLQSSLTPRSLPRIANGAVIGLRAALARDQPQSPQRRTDLIRSPTGEYSRNPWCQQRCHAARWKGDASAKGARYLCSASAPAVQPRILHLAEKQVSLVEQFVLQIQIFFVEHEKVFVVAMSTLIMSFSHTALRPVLPVFAKGFGVGATAVGITMSVYACARLVMNLPAGLIADRQGRRPLLVWGPAITALGMLGCGMASSFQQLLLWRWVTGIGSALQMTGAQLFLADICKPGSRARALGLNHSASLLGSLVGPAVGGLLADHAGLHAPFTFTGVAAGLAALYGAVRLPETRPSTDQQQPGNLAAVAGPQDQAARQPGKQGSASSGGASTDLAATAQQTTHSARAGSTPRHLPAWRQLLGSRDFRAIAVMNAVMFATANGGRSVLMPLLAIESFGMTTSLLGLLFAVMAVVSLVGIMPAAFVADHLGRKWTIVPSCIGLAAAILIMASSGQVQVFAGAAMLYAAAHACLGATPNAYAADVTPQCISGFGLGMYRCAGDLGLMIGPALLGCIADMTSVQIALQANALLLLATVMFFGWQARESCQFHPAISS